MRVQTNGRCYSDLLYRKQIGTKKFKSKNSEYEYSLPVYKNVKKKIRVLSDLHLDVNKDYPLELEDKDTFTVICGDIAGEYEYAKEWLNNNIKNGIIIEGNHILYNRDGLSLQELYKRYQKDYTLDNNVTFLQNNHKVIDNIVFVGCTLWTNYRLFGRLSTWQCERYMNDFRWGCYEECEWTGLNSKFIKTKLEPKHCIHEFYESLQYIDSVCEEYPNNKIVVVTHHCPSIKCIDKFYSNDECTPAYASNLESFIKDHSNIVCWLCGHSHNQCDFEIDGCRVVMNCRGYCYRNEDKNFNPNKTILI